MGNADRRALIHQYFESYKTGDRGAIESLLSASFTFTSPYDDHIDRTTYFDRCWAKAGAMTHDLSMIMTEGDDAIVHYDGVAKDGSSFRNIERFHFDGNLIDAVEVFHGLPQGEVAENPREAIMTVLEQRKDALEVKDARLVAAKHTPDTVVFSLAPPLQQRGEAEEDISKWFKTWKGEIEWETRDPQISVSGDVAFVTALEHMGGTKTDGEKVDLWFRVTFGLRKVDGEWKIAHEHQSVPFYMDGSLKAAVDLKPEEARRSGRSLDREHRGAMDGAPNQY